ncbi:hypothetical protein DSH65_15135 [Enterococcus faecalis]|uniref:Uncharacterized protein n=1 Tax=Enterococcus faecalis TaxID=1351 RepID=A0ABD7IVM6_ENTFL|nr:hypothetical protein [Enterococcus faecalis]EGO8469866.1 hypothetical protein [Enterococcus faecalis]EGO8482742.1 hypothetical protein [Enterococcus faecalis]EGO8541442.1 hypothetical protein [Enterococcus faecalis]EGO8643040.1 hypothetical protein [Enterococcus faecalis]
MSKAKPVIRLLTLGQTLGTNNYSDLNRISFIISNCRRSFNGIETNVLTFLLHNYRSIFLKMA